MKIKRRDWDWEEHYFEHSLVDAREGLLNSLLKIARGNVLGGLGDTVKLYADVESELQSHDEAVRFFADHLGMSGIKDVKALRSYLKGSDPSSLAADLVSDAWRHYQSISKHSLKPISPLDIGAPPLTETGPQVEADVPSSALDVERNYPMPGKQPSEGDQRGFTLPGSHYIGPGNSLDSGPPTSVLDAEARIHDFRYSQLQSMGVDPYTHFTAADQELLSAAAREKGFQAALVETVFELKKHFLPHTSLQETLPAIASYNQEQDMEDGEQSSTLGGGGGGGAPVSLWSNECAFENGKCISTFTRQVLVPFDPEQRYMPISLSDSRGPAGEHSYASQLSHPILGYETPWRYFDLNCAQLFFSPNEWQHLLEGYGGIRPRSLEIFVSNVVIKDVTKGNNDQTQVTDSGSGALAIFTDETYDYPYVLGNGQDSLPSALPFKPYIPPKYAYLTIGKKTGLHQDHGHWVGPTPETSFYILEQSTYLMLKQGTSYSHKYTFPGNLPWKRFYTPGQNWLTMGNPLLDSRYFSLKALGSHARWEQIKKDDFGKMPQNWQPGPLTVTHVGKDGWHGGNDEVQAVLTGTSVGVSAAERWSLRPGLTSQATAWEDADNPDRNRNFKVSVDALALGTQHNGQVDWENARLPDDKHMAKTLQTPDTFTYSVKTNKRGHAFTENVPDDRGLVPGAIWNERQWNLEDQIWAKIPSTDHHFMTATPALGGWGLERPPPQTFFKLVPQYAEATPNDVNEASIDAIIPLVHQYGQFTLSARLEWDLEPATHDARWNPQPAITPPHGGRAVPYVPYENAHNLGITGFHPGQIGYDQSDRLWGSKTRVRPL